MIVYYCRDMVETVAGRGSDAAASPRISLRSICPFDRPVSSDFLERGSNGEPRSSLFMLIKAASHVRCGLSVLSGASLRETMHLCLPQYTKALGAARKSMQTEFSGAQTKIQRNGLCLSAAPGELAQMTVKHSGELPGEIACGIDVSVGFGSHVISQDRNRSRGSPEPLHDLPVWGKACQPAHRLTDV